MDIYQLVADYIQFWRTYFPEGIQLTREKANQRVGTPYLRRLLTSAQLRQLQDSIAPIYGAWALEGYQLSFMKALLLHLATTTTGGTLLSLGSGPASLELFLLLTNLVDSVILVDISDAMLRRALSIASQLGLSDRVKVICGDVTTVTLPIADKTISIGAMHWSTSWQKWIEKAAESTKPGGLVFLEASMNFAQSGITREEFLGVAARSLNVTGSGFLLPLIEGLRAADLVCFYAAGLKRPKTIKEKPTKQKKKR